MYLTALLLLSFCCVTHLYFCNTIEQLSAKEPNRKQM